MPSDDTTGRRHDGWGSVDPRSGTALCLSGGGYRAMLFHVGALVRLNDAGLLRSIDRISSVSGGSITSATLALAWRDLDFGTDGVARRLDELVVEPLRALATRTIDRGAVLGGLLVPGRTIGQSVANAYDRHLFRGATLRAFPDDTEGPRFVINATNVHTGRLFRFSRPYEGDYSVGLWRDPVTRVADAVAASAAFPPVLSPHTVTPSGRFDPTTAGDHLSSVPARIRLSDGGVYDNLGLETAKKRCRCLLVSDGGGQILAERAPRRDWARHTVRVLAIIDSQVRALRKRDLLDAYQRGSRTGAYWGIRSEVAAYGLSDALPMAAADVALARAVPTRLAALDDVTQRALINWGYVVSDTALRRRYDSNLTTPSALPLG